MKELGTLNRGTILCKKPNTDPFDTQKDRRHTRDCLKGLLEVPIIDFGTFCQFRQAGLNTPKHALSLLTFPLNPLLMRDVSEHQHRADCLSCQQQRRHGQGNGQQFAIPGQQHSIIRPIRITGRE